MNFWKLVRAGFHAILTCGPAQTSFQVDIEIYEDKLSQSGDRILSSHITICNILQVYQIIEEGKESINTRRVEVLHFSLMYKQCISRCSATEFVNKTHTRLNLHGEFRTNLIYQYREPINLS